MTMQKRYLTTLGNLISVVILVFLFLQLTGCATAGKNSLPQGGDMTMAQIYQKETGLSMQNNYDASSDQTAEEVRQRLISERMPVQKINYADYSVASTNASRPLFKPLSNPEIPMYIYPHLVSSDAGAEPVPGYTTAFFMYKENHFAMPSEDY